MSFVVLFYAYIYIYTQMWEEEFYVHYYYRIRADELIRTENYSFEVSLPRTSHVGNTWIPKGC